MDRRILRKFGQDQGVYRVDAVITDINDIGKVDILAATDGVNGEALVSFLKDNPHGNDDQQTPIVVLVSSENMQKINAAGQQDEEYDLNT